MEEKLKNKDILEVLYRAEENNLDEIMLRINREISEQIKDINTEELLQNATNKDELLKAFQTIEENYSIKISAYVREFYKKGFSDGVNLMLNCLK